MNGGAGSAAAGLALLCAAAAGFAADGPGGGAPSSAPSVAARDWPNVRPLTERHFEATPERRVRGEYLVEHLLQCIVCHSERDWSQPGGPPVAQLRGAGAVWMERGERRLVAPNITSDATTGAGRWTDDMLARAIREGVAHDGRPLHPQMWYGSFRALPDEDLAAVVVYLRTLPAVRRELPPTVLPEADLERIAAGLRPILEPVAAPPADTAVARGAHLLALADCAGCHTAWHSPRMPGLFAGGNRIARGEVAALSTNLTPHATGLLYGSETFAAVMRTGRFGTLSPTMPWIAFRGLTDGDLADMHAALAATAPVAHAVHNGEPPTACAVCGAEHGAGARNRVVLPRAARLRAADATPLAGRYHFAEYAETITVEVRGATLWLVTAEEARHRMFPVAPDRFEVPGWLAPLEVVRDAAGAVRGLRAAGPWPDLYERQ